MSKSFSLYCSAATLFLAAGFSAAQASVVAIRGNNQDQVNANILLDIGETSLITGQVLGDVAGGPANIIRFTSSTDVLVSLASGQAQLSSLDFVNNPGQANDENGINQLTITTVNPYLGFEAIQFAFDGEAGTQIQFTVADQLPATPDQIFNFTLLGAVGQDRFTFNTDVAQYITSLSFTSNAGVAVSLAEVQQFRIGALIQVPGPIAGAGFPALFVLGGVAWMRRRQA